MTDTYISVEAVITKKVKQTKDKPVFYQMGKLLIDCTWTTKGKNIDWMMVRIISDIESCTRQFENNPKNKTNFVIQPPEIVI